MTKEHLPNTNFIAITFDHKFHLRAIARCHTLGFLQESRGNCIIAFITLWNKNVSKKTDFFTGKRHT